MAEKIWITDGAQFTCSPYLDAIYVQKTPWGSSSGSFKVYCPTLMPNIPMGLGKKLSPVTLNKSMFCNSSDCAITPMSQVVPQNYITANPYPHTNFKLPHMDFGSVVEVYSSDHDFQSVYLTSNKDPSTLHP